jgi:superfamily I DNA/RNA helicase
VRQDEIILPACTYAEMLGHPLRLDLSPSDFFSQSSNDGVLDFIVVDEAQDANIAQALLVLLLCATTTKLLVVGHKQQRIFWFAAADPEALRILTEDATEFKLSNNFRSVPQICDTIDHVLQTECNCPDQITRPVRKDLGEIIHNANLADSSILDRWLSEGSVAFVSRLTAVIVALLHVRNLA